MNFFFYFSFGFGEVNFAFINANDDCWNGYIKVRDDEFG
jgi:hypothetical protein